MSHDRRNVVDIIRRNVSRAAATTTATAAATADRDSGLGVDTDPTYIGAAPPTADGATAGGAAPVGADVAAVPPVPTRKRRGKHARRGRDDEYYVLPLQVVAESGRPLLCPAAAAGRRTARRRHLMTGVMQRNVVAN